MTTKQTLNLQGQLLAWYQTHHRDLPWRRTCNPYGIWISEVMLQQTQVETVIPYYLRFLQKFPNISALAAADLSAVLKAWEGLGYYARARNLHRAAEIIRENHQGSLPRDYNSLRKIPGVGDYTAAAIASLAFGQVVPVLDGNARRVFSRWIALQEYPSSPSGQSKLRRTAEEFLAQDEPGLWNQAVMELGALVCVPRWPHCLNCPVSDFCQAKKEGLEGGIPLRKKRAPLPHYQVTAALIKQRGKILITRRPEKGLLGGLWEFPGGKQEAGETLEECLRRELAEELDVEVAVGLKFCAVNHAYTHFRITLHVFHCRLIARKPKALGCTDWKWVAEQELEQYAFPRADRHVIQKILQEMISE